MKLETVKKIYRTLNAKNFGGVLTEIRLSFSRTTENHAHYDGQSIEFNLVDTKGFSAVTELVYHEMIHQYIDEFLELKVKEDHGKEFKKQYNKFSQGITLDPEYCYV